MPRLLSEDPIRKQHRCQSPWVACIFMAWRIHQHLHTFNQGRNLALVEASGKEPSDIQPVKIVGNGVKPIEFAASFLVSSWRIRGCGIKVACCEILAKRLYFEFINALNAGHYSDNSFDHSGE